MAQFTVHVDESVVQTFGHAHIEQYLQDIARKMLLKAAAHDVLEDLSTIDLHNDTTWQTARNLAWQQEQHKYIAAK
ncbi:MAG: hypothetical protein H9535_08680 [Ignavibacteria bacterium]|nr:hypothetical protein [Ignavibacteria bacterium]